MSTPEEPGPPRNLWGENVTASSRSSGSAGVHVDRHVGGGGREVHERHAARAVHELREGVVRRRDAGDVRAGGEGADLDGPVAVLVQQRLEGRRVHQAPLVGRDHHHVADGLAPGRLVGVVLHVGHEDHGPLARTQVDAGPEARRGLDAEDALELVDRAGHPRAEGDDHVVGAGVHVRLEDAVRLVVGEGHRGPGGAGLGVGVAHERPEVVQQPLLDGAVQAPAGGPVGVDDPLGAVRGPERLVRADGVQPEGLEVLLQVLHDRLHRRDDCRT
jgi:hypothetical protein